MIKLSDWSLLDHIDPVILPYDDWLHVGMAIKAEDGSLEQFISWSSRDPKRFKALECQRKWDSFNGNGVGWGTVVRLAELQGWTRPRMEDQEPHEYSSLVNRDKERQPVDEMREYLRVMFQPDENVRIVTQTFKGSDGKYRPGEGTLHRVGDLLDGAEIGPYDPEAGAFVSINPLDGGIKQENVTAYRHALIESDSRSVEEQERIIRELKLPCTALVHSGNKSIHALVRVDAKDLEEYKKRVGYLHDVCTAFNLKPDKTKDAGRLSRLPGVQRGEQRQHLRAVNIGTESWDDWVTVIEGQRPLEPARVADAGHMEPPLFNNGLIAGGFGLLIGEDGIGKGWMTLDLLLSCALGRRVNIMTVCHDGYPLRVAYLCYEDPLNVLKWRLDRISKRAGISPEAWRRAEEEGFLTVFDEERLQPLFEQLPHEVPKKTGFFAKLEQYLRASKTQLCVIDPLAAAAILQAENDNAAMNRVAVSLRAMAKRTGCAVVLTHHTAKAASGSTHHHASRGGSALPGASRWQLQLVQADDDESPTLNISKNSYGRRIFGVPLVREEDGVVRELTDQEIASQKNTLMEKVIQWMWDHQGLEINYNGIMNGKGDAAKMVQDMGSRPKDVKEAVDAAVKAGKLKVIDTEKNGRGTKILVIPKGLEGQN